MGLVALYCQASKAEGMGLEEGLAIVAAFLLAEFVFIFALGCGLPLKRVLNGDRVAPE